MFKKFKVSIFIIAAICGTILSFAQIYDWTKMAISDLTADINYGYWTPKKELFILLNEYITLVDTNEMIERIDVNELRKYMDEKTLTKTVDLLKPEFQKYLYRSLPSYLLSIGSQAAGYWSVEIKNDTNHEVSKVYLYLPYTCSVFIQTEDGGKKFSESDGRINLGTLQPKEVAYVFAWTTIKPDLFWLKSEIKLTHSNGIGKLTLYKPVGPFGQFCSEYRVLLLLLVAICIYISVSAGYFLASPTKENSADKKGDNKPEEAKINP